MTDKQIKILLIGDHSVNTDPLRKILSLERNPTLVVEQVEGLPSGLKRLAQRGIDAVLLNSSQTGIQGNDAVVRIHAQAPEVPVIIIRNGFNEDTLPPETVRKGACEFLMNDPLDSRMLSRTIRYEIERKQLEKDLEVQARHDSLTGLYNRRYFSQRLKEEIARADRTVRPVAILLCDLDRFKAVNDAFGHQVGDSVLQALATSIREATRGTDLVFRWGGDEIIVILSNTLREGIFIAAERIRRGVLQIGKQRNINLDLSIGVALYPEHGKSEDVLLRVADKALYICKKGAEKIHFGMEEYNLGEHSINVVFQPIVNIQPIVDIQSNKVIGHETLARDPEGKVTIVELFKKYEAIGKLKELKSICFKTQLKEAEKFKLPRLFINVDFNVIGEMEPLSKPSGTDVVLEISEMEAMHDVEGCLKIARKWQEKGYKFALDDFGAGFISLPFIAQLIPDYIKIDRSTILLAVSSDKFRMVLKELLVGLKHCAKEGMIAEGVETEEELNVVKDLGIHIVQGFLFGKPKALK